MTRTDIGMGSVLQGLCCCQEIFQTTSMATDVEQAFYIERHEIAEDSDEEYHYEEVPVDEDFSQTGEEDLDTVLRVINEAKGDEEAYSTGKLSEKASTTITRPEVVDDFVRNFLVRMGLMKTLDTFQSEWYELVQKGAIREEDTPTVPDVYKKNSHLDIEKRYLSIEVDKFKRAAMQARDTYVKLKKERDFHRMHHRRVVQEKNKLITDIKRLKTHYTSYEPTLRQLKTKYETAMKEKMLSKLEKDRALGKVTGLQNTLKNLDSLKDVKLPSQRMCKKGLELMVDAESHGPSQRKLVEERRLAAEANDAANTNPGKKVHELDTDFPPDQGINPILEYAKSPPSHLTRTGGFRLTSTFQGHSLAVGSLALHPRKHIIATTSDDHTWKMWAVPSGDLVMTGEGHTDWVSSSDFHPSGGRLATGSGDTTVKIWDFAKGECVHTFTEHKHAVWGVSWHSCGDFLASCSMDNDIKVWDMNSLRSRYTLRGHTDSVNSIEFLPFSNTLLSSSADKTLSLWDARTGICAQTFYGHMYSVNSATFNSRGDVIASCDSYGILRLFDVRTLEQLATVDIGPHPANHVTFDSCGQLVSVSSNDATVKFYEVATGKVSPLLGHEDAVQTTLFDRAGEFLVSAGSDRTVRIWS